MGREIRRVPKGWEHPKNEGGHYKPLLDEDYEEAVASAKEWDEEPPDSEYCRPKFDTPADCYQVYENVTEGTPVSPVFETQGAMRQWLIAQGHSEHAADKFIEGGYVPSMVVTPQGIFMGIDSLDLRK